MHTAIHNQTLLAGVVQRHPMPLDQVKAAAKEVLSIIKDGLLRDGSVRVQNFGTFRLKHVAERQGRNPQTGEAITIKAQNRVVFTPAKALRELIEPNRAKATPVTVNKDVSKPVAQPVQAAALVSSPIRVSTTPPQSVESAQPEYEVKKSNGKYYLVGASAALLAGLLVFFLHEDQEISTPPVAISSQAIMTALPATTIQSAPENQLASDQPVIPMDAEHMPAATEEQVIAETPVTEKALTTDTVTASNAAPVIEPLQTEQEVLATPFFAERQHRLVRGESLWRLAKSNYGEALLWPHIFQANRDNIKNPDRLHENRHIQLPTLQGHADALTLEDRYHIAEGYYLAYLHYKSIGDKDSFFALLEAKRYSPVLVKEKMSSLNLSKLEKILLKHQTTL